MKPHSVRAVATAALLPLSFCLCAEERTAYPVRPIRLIVPTTPGGPPDIIAREIGAKISAALGQPIIVDNRPGAGGAIGLETLAKAPADGYTLGVIGMPFIAVTPRLLPRLPYNTERDFALISLVAWNYNILAVPVSSAITSVAQLVATAKAKPGLLRYSSGGNGTPAHLTSELLKREAAIDMLHVPYKGAPAAVSAVLAGEVDMIIGATGALTPHLSTGRLRALATAAPTRIQAYPDLPTLVELGYPKVVFRDWQAVFAPNGTPTYVMNRLRAEITKSIAASSSRQRLEALGMEVASMEPQQALTQIRADINQAGQLITDMSIKAD
jgi:tripartite-type tricarboxylate transporter receptor subunit TctC